MPDPFFASTKTRKRKRPGSVSEGRNSSSKAPLPAKSKSRSTAGQPPSKQQKRTKRDRDEELSDKTSDNEGSIGDMDLRAEEIDDRASGDEDEDETPAEKRLRLAKLYLESVKSSLAEGDYDAAEIDKELVASRLKRDVLEHSGRVHLFIADSFDFSEPPIGSLRLRGHRFSVTSALATESGKYLLTAGKEGNIVKWDLHTGKKIATFYKAKPETSASKGKGKQKIVSPVEGHSDEVLSLAISGDEKLLASAGRDKTVGVWDIESSKWVKGFSGHFAHKDVVTSVSFKKGSQQLYSGSLDRTVKVFDLNPGVMGYVETLFGHQDHIVSLDALRGDSCVSVGSRDKTARFWKILDETQLVFRGGGRSRIREVLEGGLQGDNEKHADSEDEQMEDGTRPVSSHADAKSFIEGSMECIAMIDESMFVTGGDSGSICLWNTQKKKPIFTQPVAHGFNETQSTTEGLLKSPRWITSLASLRYTDMFASGSYEGNLRIWKVDAKLKSFSLVGTVPVPGVINSLQLVTAPRNLSRKATWISQEITASSVKQGDSRSELILIVAGVGQEHRLGRWIKVTDDGATNSTHVFVYASP